MYKKASIGNTGNKRTIQKHHVNIYLFFPDFSRGKLKLKIKIKNHCHHHHQNVHRNKVNGNTIIVYLKYGDHIFTNKYLSEIFEIFSN